MTHCITNYVNYRPNPGPPKPGPPNPGPPKPPPPKINIKIKKSHLINFSKKNLGMKKKPNTTIC